MLTKDKTTLKPPAILGSMFSYSTGVRFALYPTFAQASALRQWIGCQRVIYNAKVAEDQYFSTFRRQALSLTGEPTPLDQQYAQFKTELTPWLSEVPSQILRNGAVRWRNAKQRQLQGLAGAPVKRRAHGRQSVLVTNELFQFVADGQNGHSLLLGTPKFPVGSLRFIAHRPYQLPKQVAISVAAGRWFVSFSFETDAPSAEVLRSPAELAYEFNNLSDAELLAVTSGYDRGVVNRLADSAGTFYPVDPKVELRVQRKEVQTRRYQRKLARQVKGSANRIKTKLKLARLQNYRARCAQDWAHKTSYALVTSGTKVHVLEALQVANMTKRAKPKSEKGKWVRNGAAAKSGLNKAILSSAWGRLAMYLNYKAARRNQLVLVVPPHYSSQECSECTYTHADNRATQALFLCQRCGFTTHADINAPRVLRARGVAQLRAGVVVKPKKRIAIRRTSQPGAGCPGMSVERSPKSSPERFVLETHAAMKQKFDNCEVRSTVL
ncbi:MAG: transposase [Agitococcus sp.]|nr:transposase [Agitococcus sp.]